MSTNKNAITYGAIIIVGLIAISFALSNRQATPTPVQHQAYVEEKQTEFATSIEDKPVEQLVPQAEEPKPDGKLHVSMAAAAIFRAFSASTAMCWDETSNTYFVHFNSTESEPIRFGYQMGWNVMGAYEFLTLGNGTAALKMAGNFGPITPVIEGLNCVERTK